MLNDVYGLAKILSSMAPQWNPSLWSLWSLWSLSLSESSLWSLSSLSQADKRTSRRGSELNLGSVFVFVVLSVRRNFLVAFITLVTPYHTTPTPCDFVILWFLWFCGDLRDRKDRKDLREVAISAVVRVIPLVPFVVRDIPLVPFVVRDIPLVPFVPITLCHTWAEV